MGVESSDGATDQAQSVGLLNSLTLEGLCLLGFGISIGVLVELMSRVKLLGRWLLEACSERRRLRAKVRYGIRSNKVSD